MWEPDTIYPNFRCVAAEIEFHFCTGKGKFEGSDTATVCYGNGKPTELPKTGMLSDLAIIGIGLLVAGMLVRLVNKFARTK